MKKKEKSVSFHCGKIISLYLEKATVDNGFSWDGRYDLDLVVVQLVVFLLRAKADALG